MPWRARTPSVEDDARELPSKTIHIVDRRRIDHFDRLDRLDRLDRAAPTGESASRAMLRSVHRDTFFSCPRCACGLDPSGTRLTCGQCHGTLIPEPELIDQISGAQAQALLAPNARWSGELTEFVHTLGPVVPSTEPAFSCPRCKTTMTKHVLFAVTLDRCHAHGVWLDGRELASIVASAVPR